MNITNSKTLMVVLLLPALALLGPSSPTRMVVSGGLEIKDKDGNVRLKTVEGEDGAFSLVLLSKEGKEAISLGFAATGERSLVLGEAGGRTGVRVSESRDGGWMMSVAGAESPGVVVRSSGGSGALEVYGRDGKGNDTGMLMMVDSSGSPRLAMGKKGDRGGDGVYVGPGSAEGSWCVTTRSGNAVAGMLSAGNGAQVILSDGEQGTWMSCDSKRAELGVGMRSDKGRRVKLFTTGQTQGLLLEDEGKEFAGIRDVGLGVGALWLGSQTVGMPDARKPGFYATWAKETGAALVLRHDERTPSVVLQDRGKIGSGISVGSVLDDSTGSAALGVRNDRCGSLVVRSSTGDVVLKVPKGSEK